MMKSFLITLFLLALPATLRSAEPPPGTIIHHSPASSGLYIGSPSICILPDGSYLASHDLFGPKSGEHALPKGRIYRSTDKGSTWQLQAELSGYFWQGLFVHRKAVYAMGNLSHHGPLVIRRSTDNGKTWTAPSGPSRGVISGGMWHTAPMPVIEHRGRLWRAVEDASNGTRWGERYQACVASVAADADLLEAGNWTISNPLKRDATWLDGKFGGWLEGNAVVDPQGDIVDMLRVDVPDLPEKAALVKISENGRTTRFDPAKGFVDFPGGAKKFSIRKDPLGTGYWTLSSITPPEMAAKSSERPGGIRNTLALMYSKDLMEWEIRTVLLRHPDVVKHGFQYVDWQFEGNDIIAACRTAWDDDEGGARNNHDANFLTFHRWKNFRELARKDDDPMPEEKLTTYRSGDLEVSGTGFEIAALQEGTPAYSNRSYVWLSVPDKLKGASYTRLAGGTDSSIRVKTAGPSTLGMLSSGLLPDEKLAGWVKNWTSIRYSDKGKTTLHLFTRRLTQGETVEFPRGDWMGSILILVPHSRH